MLGLAAPGALLASLGVCGPAACEAFETCEELEEVSPSDRRGAWKPPGAAPEEDYGEEFRPLLGDGRGEVVDITLESVYADAERAGPAGCHPTEAQARPARELEADACPPFEFEAQVPQDWTPEEPVSGRGPHGSIRVRPPQGTRGGALLVCWAGPRPELRVRVPPGGVPGDEVTLRRRDGVVIAVTVPKGLVPGDGFIVAAPVLMVRVPEGARVGQRVLFHSPEGAEGELAWWRARVPEGARPRGYFCARLPPPGAPRGEGPDGRLPEAPPPPSPADPAFWPLLGAAGGQLDDAMSGV